MRATTQKGGEGKPTKRRKSRQIDLTELIEKERIRTAKSLKARIEELQEQIVSDILVYSVRKHLADKDRDTLSRRIESTIKELGRLADEMEERNHIKTAAFIRSHARFIVTFAKVALEKGIRIPYTSNAIERLMGEISKRCKHKWMSWSTDGLENILSILLIRYAEERFYRAFWQSYIHQSSTE